MEALERLHRFVERGDAAAVAACLAAGVPADGLLPGESASPLLKACNVPLRADPARYAECVHALLVAGADPNFQDWRHGCLHLAASTGTPAAVAALLAAGADAAATDHRRSWSVLHYAAARYDSCQQARLLIAAAPHTALLRSNGSGEQPEQFGACTSSGGQTPLQLALFLRSDAARPLLAEAPLPPPSSILPALLYAGKWALPLYPLWAARQPLSPADWARLPHDVPGLGAALHAVLHRSEAEAAQLVRHLVPADRQRLRTAALCLARAERLGQLPPLPTPLVWCILALCVA